MGGNRWTGPGRWTRAIFRGMPSQCERCTRQFPEGLGARQDGYWLCPDCYEPTGGENDRNLRRAEAARLAAELSTKESRVPKRPGKLWAETGIVTGWWGGEVPVGPGIDAMQTDPIIYDKPIGGGLVVVTTLRLWGQYLDINDDFQRVYYPMDVNNGADAGVRLSATAVAADRSYMDCELSVSAVHVGPYYDIVYNGTRFRWSIKRRA